MKTQEVVYEHVRSLKKVPARKEKKKGMRTLLARTPGLQREFAGGKLRSGVADKKALQKK